MIQRQIDLSCDEHSSGWDCEDDWYHTGNKDRLEVSYVKCYIRTRGIIWRAYLTHEHGRADLNLDLVPEIFPPLSDGDWNYWVFYQKTRYFLVGNRRLRVLIHGDSEPHRDSYCTFQGEHVRLK